MKYLLLLLVYTCSWGQRTPIKDDNGVLILCNGEVGDFFSGAKTINKGSVAYWGEEFRWVVFGALANNPNTVVYRNGDWGHLGDTHTERYNKGYKEGKEDAEFVASQLGKKGTVKVISHCKGSAFAVGYIKGLHAKEPSIRVFFHIMLAPYGAKSWNFKPEGSDKTIVIRHTTDLFSSELKNASFSQFSLRMSQKAYDKRTKNLEMSPYTTSSKYTPPKGVNSISITRFKAHSINSFHHQTKAAIECIMKNTDPQKAIEAAPPRYWDEKNQTYRYAK